MNAITETVDKPDGVCPVDETSNGWGGARKGAGGARAGAGRPRIEGPRPWDIAGITESQYYARRRANLPIPPKAYARHGGKVTPRGPIISIMVTMPDGKRKPGITTSGSLSQFERAWVYVGVRKSDGCVKIGMSGDPAERCRGLGISLFFAHPVVPGLAKTLETMALRRLGALKSGSEWKFCKPEDAAHAVVAARSELSRLCHTDPNETAAEAYSRRVGTAA